ncbi:MAG: hypothetical protein IPN96_14835 [Anaerolineales bacterium]|nr:hypothetical protein [Anaerolineales bacterium]
MQRKFFVLISMFVISMLLLVACGGSAATEVSSPAQDTGGTTTQATDAPIESATGFVLLISNVVGTVEVRDSANDAYAPAAVGQKLSEGAQIRTGADGIVALYRDSITMVVIDANSEAQIKTLSGTVEVPITIISILTGAAALEHHAERLPEGSIFSIETPEGNTGQILGSTVRVQYNPETKLMTATCLTGTCTFVRGEQNLTLEQGQAVDVTGLQPPPGAPEEMTVEQANQFLAMGTQLCGCEITLSEIRDGGLEQTSPPPAELSEGEATEVPSADATEVPSAEATEAPSNDDAPEAPSNDDAPDAPSD